MNISYKEGDGEVIYLLTHSRRKLQEGGDVWWSSTYSCIYNTPHWMSTIYGYASLKFLLVKLSGIKSELRRKEYIFMCTLQACGTVSLEQCQEKLNGIKIECC